MVLYHRNPVGWSTVNETLFYRFAEAPTQEDLRTWIHSEEVALKQERHCSQFPLYLLILVPDDTDYSQYADLLEDRDVLWIGISHANDPGVAGVWGG